MYFLIGCALLILVTKLTQVLRHQNWTPEEGDIVSIRYLTESPPELGVIVYGFFDYKYKVSNERFVGIPHYNAYFFKNEMKLVRKGHEQTR